MFEEHTLFIPPENTNQNIWRYIDFTKYADLLSTSSLYFTRADYFTDNFEGSIPNKTVEWRDSIERQNILSNPNYIPTNWPEHFYNQRRQIAINCWHMNEYESEAMWRLYLQSNEGIAIRSTYNLLKKSFDDTKISIHIGKVKYIDYKTEHLDISNGFNPLLHKRKSFEHERELRALVWNKELTNQKTVDLSLGGVKVPIALNTLIEKIYISPESPSWFLKLVETITIKFNYNFSIVKSDLCENPIF